LQGGPFDVTVQALADNNPEEGIETLTFEINAGKTDRGVWEGNDFIQYTIEDKEAADTVFRFNMEDDSSGTAPVVGFDGENAIEIHMKDVLDNSDDLQKLIDSGDVLVTLTSPQNGETSTLTIARADSDATQTIHFDRQINQASLEFSVNLKDDILNIGLKDTRD